MAGTGFFVGRQIDGTDRNWLHAVTPDSYQWSPPDRNDGNVYLWVNANQVNLKAEALRVRLPRFGC